jgi:replicative DNA helicase
MLTAPLHNVEAEQSVLGGLMLENQAWDRIADLVNENDFFGYAHQIIFKCIAILANKNRPFDFVTIAEELKKINELANVGSESYLLELLKNTPTAANIRTYAEIVKQYRIDRDLLRAANKIIDMIQNREELRLDKAQQLILAVAENKAHEPRLEHEYAETSLTKIMDDHHSENNSVYLKTGFTDLDELIGGFELASYVILAARPSAGKTLLAVNIAENIAAAGKSVLMFSVETTAESLQYRKLARNAIVKLGRIKNAKCLSETEINSIIDASAESKKLKIAIDDVESLTVTDIRAKSRRIKNKRGLDLIIIDYVQLLRATEGDNEITKLSYISRDLRALAKELNVCILVLSQLNRNIENRTDKRPMMSDLKQSGSLEQDANMIIFIDRPERYDEAAEKNMANIYIEKNKDGATGRLQLTFSGEYCTFSNYRSTGYTPPPSYNKICKEINLD